MSEPNPELEPLPEDVADYVAAFRDVEQPDGHAVSAAWAAIEAEASETGRRGMAWIVGAGLAVAAAVLLMMFGPRLLSSDDAERAPAQAPFAGDGADSEGWARNAAARSGDAKRPDHASKRGVADTNDDDAEDPVVDEDAPGGDAARSADEDPGLHDAMPGEATGVGEDATRGGPKSRRTPRPRKDDASSSEPEAPPPNPLREEAALFGRAKLALNGGDAKAALRLLDEHADRFPKGALATEAKVLRAEALCALGRKTQAQKLRDRFIERHSGSTLAARMADVCR